MTDITLNGGVLIIGSLLWDDYEIRKKWRDQNLSIENRIRVQVPIRYGRLSAQRSHTHTMVFSMDCDTANKGESYFVPFLNNPLDYESLKAASLDLKRAEMNSEALNNNYFHWGWGCVVLCINPQIREKGSVYLQMTDNLKRMWQSNYQLGFTPIQYKIGGESPVVNKNGELLISWPDGLEDYDFLIATATKPELPAYPTALEIARQMLDQNYTAYYMGNVCNSISTFQDIEINSMLTILDKRFARVVWHEFGHFIAHYFNKKYFNALGIERIEIQRRITSGALDYEGNTILAKPTNYDPSVKVERQNLPHHLAALVYGCFTESIFTGHPFNVCFAPEASATGYCDIKAVMGNLSHHNILGGKKSNVYRCIDNQFEIIRDDKAIKNLFEKSLTSISEIDSDTSTIDYMRIGPDLVAFLKTHKSIYLEFVDKLSNIINADEPNTD